MLSEPAATQPYAPLRPAPPSALVATLEDVVALASQHRDIALKLALEREVRLVRFEPGRIEFAAASGGSRHLANDLSRRLREWTGQTWMVALVHAEGAATLHEQAQAAKGRREDDAASHPAVRAVLERFPGARIVDVRDPRAAEPTPAGPAGGDGPDITDAEPLFDDSEPDFDGVDF